MVSGPHEQVLETLEDLDARLAGLQVSYSEENATAAQRRVEDLADLFENSPDPFEDLRAEVDELVESGDSGRAAAAKDHADELRRRVEAQVDEE